MIRPPAQMLRICRGPFGRSAWAIGNAGLNKLPIAAEIILPALALADILNQCEAANIAYTGC
jgi:hypothetical protein